MFTVSVIINIKKIFKEKQSIKILKIIGLIINLVEYQKIYNHAQRKHKSRTQTVRRVLSYIDHWLIVISTIIGCVSISAFASLVGIPTEIMSSAIELKICVITSEIRKYKSIIKKTKKSMIK